MSDVLAAARRLAGLEPMDDNGRLFSPFDDFDRECIVCTERFEDPPVDDWVYGYDAAGRRHDPTCEYLQFPQIVAALELQPYLLRVAYAARSVIVCGFQMTLEYDPAEGEGIKLAKKQLYTVMQELDDFADAQRAALAGSKEPGDG